MDKKKCTINNIGQRVRLYCGNHLATEGPIALTVGEGRYSAFFNCPKFYSENRMPGETPCFNRLNFIEYERLLTYLCNCYVEAEKDGISLLSLVGKKWTEKKVTYCVIKDTPDELGISVLNASALKSIRRY